MTKPLLSICIPTFNRVVFLQRLLDGLLPQVKNANGTVNVYISDNASEDCTEKLCESYVESGFNLNYVRNDNNIGADRNIAQCFDLADGTYVWILGDDDYVLDGALVGILNILKGNDLLILYLKSIVSDCVVQIASSGVAPIIKFSCSDSISFVVGVNFTFISGVIFNKHKLLVNRPLFNYKDGIGSYLVQLTWVLTLLNIQGNYAYTKIPMLVAQPNESVGYELFSTFGTNLNKLLDLYLVDNKETSRNILKSAMWFLSTYFYRSIGLNTVNPIQVMDDVFSEFATYSYFVRPVMKLNNKPSNLVLRFFSRLRFILIRIIIKCLVYLRRSIPVSI